MSTPLVELRDVTRSFPGPPEVQALKGINLTVHDGDYVSIVGPSGSGKSTMLNILGLLDRPSVGEYRLAGHLTGALDAAQGAGDHLLGRPLGVVARHGAVHDATAGELRRAGACGRPGARRRTRAPRRGSACGGRASPG